MKRLFAVLLILFIAVPLFAVQYEIVDISFSVTGKTDPAQLSKIVGSIGATFDSADSLEAFLEEKKQDLLNLRLFSNVVYKYDVSENLAKGMGSVKVTFLIWDAKSIFILPYPKYDSNYGFKLGIKMYDKNLGGKFTNLYGYFGFTQQENEFRKGNFDWELSVSDITIGESTMTASTTGVIDLLKWGNSNFSFDAGVYRIRIKDFEMSATAGLSIAPVGSEFDSPWGLADIHSTVSFKFNNVKLDNLALKTTYIHKIQTNEFDTKTELSHNLQYGVYSLTILNTEQINKPDDVNKGLDFIELGTGAGRDFPIADLLTLNTLFMFYVQYDYEAEILVPYFDLALSSSKYDVDWIGNFRKGYSYDVRMDLLSYPINEVDRTSFRLWTSASVFYPLTSWFNPSARVSMTISDRAQYFQFSKDSAIADYIRGVRLDNPLVDTEVVPMHRNAIAFNLDLMVNFIQIKDFCKSYVNPFMDLLIVSDDAAERGFRTITTVGGEGIVILDDFPSYPIRGSLGINANDLVALAKGEKSLSEVEYEIYIGMGFLY
ncbi:MAG: hypothetical protein IJ863_07570 [Spirochaetales bacterium]|nr:hypothetical protein [Spirochaetales bacterium]